jgi:cysteinyl-tRNA synthetase
MQLYNSLSRKIEEFKPINPPTVTLYTCGPTVYDYTHIGHARKYINDDLLKRILTYFGYKVKHVMNITDVGHLTSDEDEGEDKIEKGAKKSGKTVWEVAKFYTDFFFDTTDRLNIIRSDVICKATDHIKDMTQLINQLSQKGFTYETKEAVYFDSSKFPDYGKLSGQKLEEKLKGARDDVYLDPDKKNSTDFALWFKRVGRFKDHSMYWPSPWGDGFPGWHIECSTMSMKYLGKTIDIHTGGIDHVPVHHENEIAQSEAATGKQFVRFWVHHEFLLINGTKMSKSLKNFYTLDDLEKKHVEPLALRFQFLQTHYRTQMNFTWDSAASAQDGLNNLRQLVLTLRHQTQRTELSEEKLKKLDSYREQFNQALANDLQLPKAAAVMWEMLKSNIPSIDKLDLLFEFDQVFGLKLNEVVEEKVPAEILALAQKREEARKQNDFKTSDRLRGELLKKGYSVEDTVSGFKLKKAL